MVKISKVVPKPGQSIEEALRTAPVHYIDQAMWERCPQAIFCVEVPGSPDAHYRADGTCKCAEERQKELDLRHARKVGWGCGGKLYHLVVRGEEPKSPERTACGTKAGILGCEPKPMGPACVKCRAYAAKRRWI